jgi:hypothetical protein
MAGTSHSLSRFKDRMAERFKIKILDQAKFILGIQLKISPSSISISQETYLSELVKGIVEESPVYIKALCDDSLILLSLIVLGLLMLLVQSLSHWKKKIFHSIAMFLVNLCMLW